MAFQVQETPEEMKKDFEDLDFYQQVESQAPQTLSCPGVWSLQVIVIGLVLFVFSKVSYTALLFITLFAIFVYFSFSNFI